MLALVRHFETEKNLRNLHGLVDEALITGRGVRQCVTTARALRPHVFEFDRILYGRTTQCQASAEILGNELGLPVAELVGLHSYHLGVASGLSEHALSEREPDVAQRLVLFRLGLISALELRIPDAESPHTLSARIADWWKGRPAIIDRSILVLSRSLILMINAVLTGIYPTSEAFRDMAMPNGGVRLWKQLTESEWTTKEMHDPINRWPNSSSYRIACGRGFITATEFHPGYFTRRAAVIIVPGLFGNQRFGPYNLYCQIGLKLAQLGYRCVTYDPVGSGDSTPLPRSFDGDVDSLGAVADYFDAPAYVLVSHSVGAVVAAVHGRQDSRVHSTIALAPITSIGEVLARIDEDDRQSLLEAVAIRKGVEFDQTYLSRVVEYGAGAASCLRLAVVGTSDGYIDRNQLVQIDSAGLHWIHGADHNFSSTKARNDLLTLLPDLCVELLPEWNI